MFLLLLIDLYNKLIMFQIKFRDVQRIFDYFRIRIHLIIFAMQFMLDNFIKWKTKYLKIILTKIFARSQFFQYFLWTINCMKQQKHTDIEEQLSTSFIFDKYFKFIKAYVLVFSFSLNLNSPDEMDKIEFNEVRPKKVLALKKTFSFD